LKRAFVSIDDIEDVFNRLLFAVDEIFTFRDRDHFIKSVFKDIAEMKDM